MLEWWWMSVTEESLSAASRCRARSSNGKASQWVCSDLQNLCVWNLDSREYSLSHTNLYSLRNLHTAVNIVLNTYFGSVASMMSQFLDYYLF